MATPYTTSCGISLTSIDGTDCIGDSRKYINSNIQNLGTAICELSAEVNDIIDLLTTTTVISVFTSNTSWTVPTGVTNLAEVLVVGGGGSGGSNWGGGGGGGGVIYQLNYPVVAGTTYNISIGSGGNAIVAPSVGRGNTGGNTIFGLLTAFGGGGGGGLTTGPNGLPGLNGGSGGGGSYVSLGGNALPSSGVQGYNGGNAQTYAGGGGGGASSPGQTVNGYTGGVGGNGRQVPLSLLGTTEPTYYGGGGGGGGNTGDSFGGLGGGGAGSSTGAGANGTPNTGGGGGGQGGNGVRSGAGGSGVVIIKYFK